MRSLVARWSAAIATVSGTVVILAAGAAGSASAASGSAQFGVQSHMNMGITGPVGLIAVGLGIGGLVVGLVRRRRAMQARSAAEARQPASEGVRHATGGVSAAPTEQMPTQI